jgi:hypothetical protein
LSLCFTGPPQTGAATATSEDGTPRVGVNVGDGPFVGETHPVASDKVSVSKASLVQTAVRVLTVRVDYNHLVRRVKHAFGFCHALVRCLLSRAGCVPVPQESAFLLASVAILMLGMVFASDGFTPGTVGYLLLNIVAAVIIVGSTGVFLLLLVFEVFRSVKVGVRRCDGRVLLEPCPWQCQTLQCLRSVCASP